MNRGDVVKLDWPFSDRKGSFASCINVLTQEQSLVIKRIGYLSDAAMRQIEVCRKTVMEIR
jgi:hypothetical protein